MKTNLDLNLEAQPQDPAVDERFNRAGELRAVVFRILLRSLCGCAVLPLLLGVGANGADRSAVQVWPVDPLIKVFRAEVPGKSGPALAEVARAEHASLQIVVRAEQPVSGLRAEISPFKRSKGRERLAPQAPRFVGYVPVGRMGLRKKLNPP